MLTIDNVEHRNVATSSYFCLSVVEYVYSAMLYIPVYSSHSINLKLCYVVMCNFLNVDSNRGSKEDETIWWVFLYIT